ncbi:hypothetical protein FRC08_004623 [Ceratobasidium sp. 394]|nr:hypothetical protein FRC08_004623 [Ceratobasidium sp. 394]KAG9100981.1 hypothetical protein FS749_011261 [Ceratobasidium sp. UAMH 11750]
MPPKRSNPSDSADERPAKKAATARGKAAAGSKATIGKGKAAASGGKATTGKGKARTGGKAGAGGSKASTPQLKKSTQPNWDRPGEYSQDKPTGKWGAKCVERWCLLPPYDTSIKEAQWKTYYLERSAVDKVNTSGSDESTMVVCEELLGEGNWYTLRKMSEEVAAAIFGSTLDDEHKKRIGRTLLGSLYFTDLSGDGEGDGSPRDIRSMSRLYSPFGLGTSIDLFYSYYLERGEDQFASLRVNANTIASCDASNPRRCKVLEPNARGFGDKVVRGAIAVFSGSKSTTAANTQTLEKALFGCEGWLSPLKLTNILFAAGGVMFFMEDDNKTPKSMLAKFQYFQGESNGKEVLKQEIAKLAELGSGDGDDEYGVCIPQRLLLLARQDVEEFEGESE